MPILEKAFAKLDGNYQHTFASDPTAAVAQIIGGGAHTISNNMTKGGFSDSEKLIYWNKCWLTMVMIV